jgi:hypothetical protein
MRCSKLPLLLAMVMSFPASSALGVETLEDIATVLRERFPRLEISPFVCADSTCSRTLNFVWFRASLVVTTGPDARPAAVAIIFPPRPASGADLQDLFDAALDACAEAVVSMVAPDMPRDQRVDFAARVAEADMAGIGYGGWRFARNTTSLKFRVLEAKRE